MYCMCGCREQRNDSLRPLRRRRLGVRPQQSTALGKREASSLHGVPGVGFTPGAVGVLFHLKFLSNHLGYNFVLLTSKPQRVANRLEHCPLMVRSQNEVPIEEGW